MIVLYVHEGEQKLASRWWAIEQPNHSAGRLGSV